MNPRSIVLAGILLAGMAPGAFANGSSPQDSAAPSSSSDGDYDRGVAAIKAGQYAEGIRALQGYTARVSTSADAENWLGYAYRKSGALDAAFAHYDRALMIDPKHRGAHEYLGEAYLLAGNPGKAREHLKILEHLCGTSCVEYAMLNRSIESYALAHPVAAKQ